MHLDANFYVLLSFVIFILCGYVLGKKRLKAHIEMSIHSISNQITQTKKNQQEVLEYLTQEKSTIQETEQTIQKIIHDAEIKAEQIIVKMREETIHMILKKQEHAEEQQKKIFQHFLRDLDAAIADQVALKLRDYMQEDASGELHHSFLNASLEGLKSVKF